MDNLRNAYLIIAHNEFDVLQVLLSELDSSNADFFVHIDKKVKHKPVLHVEKGNLFVLGNTVDVRWGHFSQIMAEYALMEEAFRHGPYSHYHIISGTHLPLLEVAEVQAFFDQFPNKTICSDLEKGDENEVKLKLRRYNFFLRNFASRNVLLSRFSQFLWKACIAMQKIFGIERNRESSFYKARNWISLSEDALRHMLLSKKDILKKYRFSFCGDEFFIPTELISAGMSEVLINSDSLLYCEMGRANARAFNISEREELSRKTHCVFARKFTVR